MKAKSLMYVAIAVIVLLSGAAFAQDPFDGGFSIPLDYGKLIVTMGKQNDSIQGRIFDWMTSPDSLFKISEANFPDGYQCGEDRDFAAADFNGDYMQEIVYAWNRADGGVFVGIPTLDLISLEPVAWNTPDPPIGAGVLYATGTLAGILGEIRVVAGNFYEDDPNEFVLAYLAADSTVTITVFDIDTSSLIPEAKAWISDQAIYTFIDEGQKFGTASRFDITTGDLDGDGTDEIVLIASDPAQTPESNLMIDIYDFDETVSSINLISQNSYLANLQYPAVDCLRRTAATAGDFDGDALDELAIIADWSRSDQDTVHYANTHFFDFSSDMTVIELSWGWDSTGWAHLHPKQSLNNRVDALCEYNGDLIAGGLFDDVHNGTSGTMDFVARWDGAAWRYLGSGMGGGGVFNPYVYALTVYNGDLIAGGTFSTAGGNPAMMIARWDGSTWHQLGAGMAGVGYPWVAALTVYNGDLIAAGYFLTAGDSSAAMIARWDGAYWHPLGSGMGGGGVFNPYVYALTVYNGDLIAGGEFSTAGGNPAMMIARWDGSTWHQLGSGMAGLAYSKVRALAVYDGDLYAGGYFTIAGGVTARYIARWNGTEWSMPGAGFNSDVYSLTVYNMGSHGEVLVAGGDFVSSSPDTFYRLAWYDSDDPRWLPFQQDASGASNRVRAMVEHKGDLILGGEFGSLYAPHPGNDIPSYFIGRVKPDENGVFDTLQPRIELIVDIVSDDVDFAPDSADEIIVRAYHDPSAFSTPQHSIWVYGVDPSTFEGCYRGGKYVATGYWGTDGIYGSRRTMAVGDFVDDENNIKEIFLLHENSRDANMTVIHGRLIEPAYLIPCGEAGENNLGPAASWLDSSNTVTEMIMADLDTATIELGAPNYYSVDSIVQPLVILNVPPVHYDILNDTTWDVSNRYPWPPDENYETYCAYGNRQDWVTSVQSEVRKDWGISAGLQTNFSSCGATVKAHLSTEYGEGFSEQGEHSTTLSVIQAIEAQAEDMVLAASIDYDVWEYPVYRRGERLVGADVVVVDPSEVRKVWYTGKEIESWISDHEVENVFSYERYPELADNPMVASDGVIQGFTWQMSPSAQGFFLLRKEEFAASTVEESNHFGVEVGASIGYEGGLSFFGLGAKWGFEVSVEGTYSRSELNTYTTTFTTADSLLVQYGYINSSGSFEGNRKYEVTPYAYWAKNGALVLDYAAGVIGNPQGEDPTWWQLHYSNPDPAFILPWRLDPEKDGTQPGENRYKTREIVFIPNHPSPGDTVLIIARVHNFSLVPTPMGKDVQVSFYLGDPDDFGQLLYDKNTGDSIFAACDVDGVSTVIASQGEAAAQMVWSVPTDGSITECQRIWALIDPLDSISPEVHDNDAEVTNNKGWNRLDVNTANTCYDPDGDGWVASTYRCCDELSQWDNCPTVYNPDQADVNGDGIGDACQYMCGDANGDFTINVGDAVYLVTYIFKQGPAPDPLEAGDANCDGTINVGDAVYLVTYIFKGGPAPCCP